MTEKGGMWWVPVPGLAPAGPPRRWVHIKSPQQTRSGPGRKAKQTQGKPGSKLAKAIGKNGKGGKGI